MQLPPEKAAPAARQYRCVNCNDLTFYVMLQPDGSIEVFCQRHNHRQVLVNLPKLIASAFDDTLDVIQERVIDADIHADPSRNS